MQNASIRPTVCKLCVRVHVTSVSRKATMMRILGYSSPLVVCMKLKPRKGTSSVVEDSFNV